jgi:hypothetical protein
LITEPTLRIERKGLDGVDEPNFMHLFMATNEEWAINAGLDERRFFVVEVSEAHKQDHAYFNAVNEEMKNGGREALLSWLLTREVSHDDVRRVPRTEELGLQQEKSLPSALAWWRECLALGYIGREPEDQGWPEEVNVTHLHDRYVEWCERHKVTRGIVNVIDLGRRVLKPWLGPPTPGKGGLRGQSIRVLAPLAKAREIFDGQTGTPTQWEEQPFGLEA